MLADDTHQQSTKVGVYVGCMWAHEFVVTLPHLVSTSSDLSVGWQSTVKVQATS